MPKTRMPSINSEVAIGRRMKGSEMLIAGGSANQMRLRRAPRPRSPRHSGLGCRHPNPGALRQPVLSFHDHFLAAFQSLRDDGDAVLHAGDLDGAPLDR